MGRWALVGARRVSVRLGGKWQLQRWPGNPTCFAPSCTAHSVLARALLASCLRGCCGGLVGTCRGLARLREAGWQVAPSTAPGNPTWFAPSCTAHFVLARAPLAGCLNGCCGRLGALAGGSARAQWLLQSLRRNSPTGSHGSASCSCPGRVHHRSIRLLRRARRRWSWCAPLEAHLAPRRSL